MSIGPSAVGNDTQTVAQQLFKRLDANGDNKLTADEFKTFFDKLLQELSTAHTTPGVGTASTAVAPSASPFADVKPLKTYANVSGWDESRLNNPTDMSPKYQFQRAIQDLGNPAPTTENLQNLVIPYLQSKGLDIHLKEGSKDVVVINNSPYTQDVIFDVGGTKAAWMYVNTDEAEAYYHAHYGTGV